MVSRTDGDKKGALAQHEVKAAKLLAVSQAKRDIVELVKRDVIALTCYMNAGAISQDRDARLTLTLAGLLAYRSTPFYRRWLGHSSAWLSYKLQKIKNTFRRAKADDQPGG